MPLTLLSVPGVCFFFLLSNSYSSGHKEGNRNSRSTCYRFSWWALVTWNSSKPRKARITLKEKNHRNKLPCWLQELTLPKYQTASDLRPMSPSWTSVNHVSMERQEAFWGLDSSLLAYRCNSSLAMADTHTNTFPSRALKDDLTLSHVSWACDKHTVWVW